MSGIISKASKALFCMSLIFILGFGLGVLLAPQAKAVDYDCYYCVFDRDSCVIEASLGGVFAQTLYAICDMEYEACLTQCIETQPEY